MGLSIETRMPSGLLEIKMNIDFDILNIQLAIHLSAVLEQGAQAVSL